MLALCALLAFAAAVARVDATDPYAGNWSRPSIERLSAASFTTNFTLYRVGSGENMTFSFEPSAGAEPAVLVKHNPNASAWELIEIEYNATLFAGDDAVDGYYAAGYAEGYLTWDAMYSTYVNQAAPLYAQMMALPNATAFVEAHIRFLRHHPTDTPFGKQLQRQMQQIDGLRAGYLARYFEVLPANASQLSWLQVFLISYSWDLQDVITKFTPWTLPVQGTAPATMHCSALLKLTPTELYFAHTTWFNYNCMLRQFKTYTFGDGRVSMSSYAGSIASLDDFYMTGHQLAVTETTNDFVNASLCDLIVPESVSEIHRVMIANYLAETPEQWFQLFSTENSGTYNNQYIVANMAAARDALDASKPLPPGTVYVGEQIPGLIVYEDQTEHLNIFGYWAAFNLPYYKQIYDLSGFAVINNGSYGFWSYTNYSRPVIFNRMQNEVVDASTMWYLMRYNNWQHDPASRVLWCKQYGGPYNCSEARSSAFAIAARYDLGPSMTEPEGPAILAAQVWNAANGAIDLKLTSASLLTAHTAAYIINGPTNVQQPTFDFDAYAATYNYTGPRRGVQSYFDFAPIRVAAGFWQPPTTDSPVPAPGAGNGDGDDKKRRNLGIGLGVAGGVLGVSALGFLVFQQLAPKLRDTSSYQQIGNDGERTMV